MTVWDGAWHLQVEVGSMAGCFAFEVVCELVARTHRAVMVVSLLRVGGARPEPVATFGDLVVDAVPGERAGGLVPALCGARAFGLFAERVACPLGAAFDLLIGELVAQVGVLTQDRVDRARQTVAFLADRGWVAEVTGKRRSLCKCAFELVLGAGQRRGQPGALDEVRVRVAAEPPLAWRWEPVELAAERIASLR